MEKTIGISELRKSISEKVKEVHENRIRYIIMQRSKAKAVLISPEEIEKLEVTADKKLQAQKKQIEKEKKPEKKDNKKVRSSAYEDFFGKKHLDRSKY